MSLWVKICANTSAEDAQWAAEAGADAVGFVFAPSPRRVTLEQVATIVPQLSQGIEKIGVFVDADVEEIAATVKACRLTGVQLHAETGTETPARLRALFGNALRILRVVHFGSSAPKPPQRLRRISMLMACWSIRARRLPWVAQAFHLTGRKRREPFFTKRDRHA